jgi:hypothetical protein
LVIEKDCVNYYEDGYKDYIDNKKKDVVKKEEVKKENLIKAKSRKKPQYNISKIENELVKLEELLETKRDLRYEPEYYQDSKKMQELDEEIDDIHNQIHALEEKYLEAIEERENE